FGANTEHTDRVERRHDSRRTARSRASARTPEGYHRGASWPGTASNQTNMARYSSPTSDLLFTAPQGGPYSPRNFARRVWEPAVEHAGLTPLRIHDLRHTAVGFWIEAGLTESEIAARAGWGQFLPRYRHILRRTEQRAN